MDTSLAYVNTLSSPTDHQLLVRHFPSWLSQEEKESLLRHFGARDVVVMGTKGKMRNCAMVTFASSSEAKWALGKLHQLDVFEHKLSVEFVRPTHMKQLQEQDTDSWSCNKSRLSDPTPDTGETVVEQTKDLRPHLKSATPPRYLYPPPTPTTLNNITNAIACVPQLYVQVLHLMNRMNLPPPFGDPTPTPPLLLQPGGTEEPADYRRESEEEGSEISSDEDGGSIRRARPTHLPRRAPKRRIVSYRQVKSLLPSMKKRRMEDEESQTVTQTKKIELNIPSEIHSLPEAETHTVTYIAEAEKPPSIDPPCLKSITQAEPSAQIASDTPTDVQPERETSIERSDKDTDGKDEEFISTEKLKRNRISEREMGGYPVFSKYSPGQPSMRLYIKNLGKHVEEKDLRYIYGRYVNWSSEKESNAFDIRLMQTGRMKGQAFVGFPSEEVATRALRETNGYVLHDRPMVVQYGRSTKAKAETS